MKKIGLMIVILLVLTNFSLANKFDFKKGCNNISLYHNGLDDFSNAGNTLQLVFINSFKLFTWFDLEITGDIDRDLQEKGKTANYFEFGLVKNVWSKFSLNYQRIHGTYVNKPVNQFGVRFTF
jgi:hypothetical protein